MHIPRIYSSYAPLSAGGNWMQDVATSTASTADWMSNSKGPSAIDLAANAFAAAHQITVSSRNSIAVNTGIGKLRAQLAAPTSNVMHVNRLV
jgi:hypothetical protein